jgi:hypothetical protein
MLERTGTTQNAINLYATATEGEDKSPRQAVAARISKPGKARAGPDLRRASPLAAVRIAPEATCVLTDAGCSNLLSWINLSPIR